MDWCMDSFKSKAFFKIKKLVKIQSLKERFFMKSGTGVVQFVLSFITIGMLPRALGVEMYGNYGFITTFFNNIVKFLKFGVPTAYYVKISKKPEEKTIIGFYMYYLIMIILLVAFLVASVYMTGLEEVVWPNQANIFIFAGAALSIFYLLSEFLRSTADSFGLTFSYEKIVIVQSIITVGVIVSLYVADLLTLKSLYLASILILIFVILFGWYFLHKNNIILFKNMRLTKIQLVEYFKEFYQFSSPLIINGIVVVFAMVFDIWLIQYYYGSVEQGYYTLALKISAIVILLISPISVLLLREMSQKYEKKGKKEIRKMYKKYSYLFYFIAAYFSIFISLNAEYIGMFIGGDEFEDAAVIIMLMALYPIHNIYGLIISNILLVRKKTNILRNITLITLIPGIAISFFLIAPVEAHGFGLGSMGLAIKVIALQFIGANICLMVVARYLKLSFLREARNQLVIFLTLYAFVKLSQYSVLLYIDNMFISFIISGAIYSVLVYAVIIFYPAIIGITSAEVKYYKESIKKIIKLKLKRASA